MRARAWHTVKGALLVFVALVAWAVLQLTVGHSWHEESAVGIPAVDATGLWRIELLANLPEFVYFLIVGALLFGLSGPFRTIWWAVVLGLLAMGAKALARNYTFHQGLDFVDVGVLFVDLVVPAVFAIAGAVVARMVLPHSHGGQRAT